MSVGMKQSSFGVGQITIIDESKIHETQNEIMSHLSVTFLRLLPGKGSILTERNVHLYTQL